MPNPTYGVFAVTAELEDAIAATGNLEIPALGTVDQDLKNGKMTVLAPDGSAYVVTVRPAPDQVWCSNQSHPRNAHPTRGNPPYGDDRTDPDACAYPHDAHVAG